MSCIPFKIPKINFKKNNQLSKSTIRRLHEYVDKRHKQLGPIFREPLGPIDGVFLSAPDLMRKMFLYEGKYPNHPLPDSWNLYNSVHNCKRGLLFMYDRVIAVKYMIPSNFQISHIYRQDEEWLTNRKIMNGLLLRGNPKFAECMTQRYSQQMVAEWNQFAQNDTYVEIPDLLKSLYRWSINGNFEVSIFIDGL